MISYLGKFILMIWFYFDTKVQLFIQFAKAKNFLRRKSSIWGCPKSFLCAHLQHIQLLLAFLYKIIQKQLIIKEIQLWQSVKLSQSVVIQRGCPKSFSWGAFAKRPYTTYSKSDWLSGLYTLSKFWDFDKVYDAKAILILFGQHQSVATI